MGFMGNKTFESSASNSKCIDDETLGKSCINNRNKSAPKMEPWGTPYLIVRTIIHNSSIFVVMIMINVI